MTNLALLLNESLKESNEAKEYFLLKEALEKDEYVTSLLKCINETQKEAKECLANNDLSNYKIKVLMLETLKQEFINHPLINNYMVCKEAMYQVLQEVVDILSDSKKS